MHATINKFGYPASCLLETEHWAILLRPAQVTLGSLVLACKDPDVLSLSALSDTASLQLPHLCARMEEVLRCCFGASRFNYLCLMMVDPHVHFHVLPRYAAPVRFDGQVYHDAHWPGPPDIKTVVPVTSAAMKALHARLRDAAMAVDHRLDDGGPLHLRSCSLDAEC